MATKEPTLTFHPALYIAIYPNSSATTDAPRTTDAQFSFLTQQNNPFRLTSEKTCLLDKSAPTRYVIESDTNEFASAGVDLAQML